MITDLFINIGSKDSEKKADQIVSLICVALLVFIAIYYILAWAHVIPLWRHQISYVIILICAIVLMAAVVIFCISDNRLSLVRYALMGAVMLTSLVIVVIVVNNYLIFALPVILCIVYNDKAFAIFVSVVSGIMMLIEPFLSFLVGNVNYNYVNLVPNDPFIRIMGFGTDSIMKEMMEFTIPSFVLFMAISLLSIWLTDLGFKNMKKYHETSVKEATVEREMSIASEIQKGMLPVSIEDNEEYAISASMTSAKSVGGDFYDFFMIDDSHVAIVIADVSGKGIPASLFMASARSALRSNLISGFQTDMAVKRTNMFLCDSNSEKLFVTAWVGVVDLESGRVSYVNAGHNPPFLVHNGSLTKLDTKPDFVLGRKRRMGYTEHRLTMEPGDRLFLYTDGVTEAVGPDGTMYGEDRLVNVLSSTHGSASAFHDAVSENVNDFVDNVDRYDDMTILVFGFEKPMVDDDVFTDFRLDRSSYNDIMKYIREQLTAQKCPENVIRDIEVSSSEILANIDMYAYQEQGGELGVSVKVKGRRAKVVFRDKGPEYDPLLKDNPDIEQRIKDHKKGGFGLFLVRKLMDDVGYIRKEDFNVLTIKRGF